MATDQPLPKDQPSLFDRLFASLDQASVEEAVRQARQSVDDARRVRLAASAAVAAAESELNVAIATLGAWRAYHGVSDDESLRVGVAVGKPTVVLGVAPERLGTARSPTGRQSMRELLGANDPATEWTIPMIAQALSLGELSHDAIGQSLARMVRDGEIFRPRRGVYTKLPPPELPGSDQGLEETESGSDSQGGPG